MSTVRRSPDAIPFKRTRSYLPQSVRLTTEVRFRIAPYLDDRDRLWSRVLVARSVQEERSMRSVSPETPLLLPTPRASKPGRLERRCIARPYGMTRSRMSSTFCSILSARPLRLSSPGVASSALDEDPVVPVAICEVDDIDEKEPFPP